MAGNIPFVGMQDLVCVIATGHRAIVKPSSKDPESMSWAVSQLQEIAPGLPVSLLSDDAPAPDAVVAMGGNDTVAAIEKRWAGIPMLLRGNRFSLAILDGAETTEELAGLADDVLSFSGLGCRNVSLVFVPRDYDFLRLQSIMFQQENSVDMKYRNNYRQARAMLLMEGAPHIDCGACLLVEKSDFPREPSILNYAFYDTLDEVIVWVHEHDDEIQCVACSPRLVSGAGQYANAGPADIDPRTSTHYHDIHPRAVALGMTQRPRLTDYPDGRDTMQFLMTI